MPKDLDKILINDNKRLEKLRRKIIDAARFDIDDPRKQSLLEILSNVRKKGDSAIISYTEKFDCVKLKSEEFRVSEEAIFAASKSIDSKLMKVLRGSIENVRRYQEEIFVGKNIRGKVRYSSMERVGLCIPGASAPLPSTVIMTAVPAIAAGVKEIAVVSPPRYEGSIHPVILALCGELGIAEVYRIGGAQAVAGLAYGTKTIGKVDMIVGPGNTWVQMAKKEVFGDVAIDSIAGPSEVLVIANDEANADWVAADMLSQAEHDPGSAIVFTDSSSFAKSVLEKLKEQVVKLARAKGTIKCLKKYSGIAVFESMEAVISAANDFAAEHLQIQCGTMTSEVCKKIKNAGAMFVGDYSPVAVGDYWAGPSHTLPTGTSAKFFSPLSCNDFVKSTSIIKYSKRQLEQNRDNIMLMARTEGLDAHARSVGIRTEK